jgi:hypothetical protein
MQYGQSKDRVDDDRFPEFDRELLADTDAAWTGRTMKGHSVGV